MKKHLKVLILGKGNIGKAVAYYLKKFKAAKKVAFFDNEKEIKNFDILIGTLPSRVGEKGLELALKYKKDLIDISVVSIPFYLKFKKEIFKKGMKVIPGCGVSPGLVNLIVGFESQNFNKINNIEISAGTLPLKLKNFFPFTWCFEDLIEEHLYPATIIKNGKKIVLPSFSGCKKDKLKEVGEFESYFVEEWNTLFYSLRPNNMSFRVIRPIGFANFFTYLNNYDFFKKENLPFIKKILTQKKEDNITLAIVKISGIQQKKKKEIIWNVFSYSKKKEKLNSMQKITAIVPAIILKLLSKGEIKQGRLIFMEDIGESRNLFREILKELRKEKSLTFLRKLV